MRSRMRYMMRKPGWTIWGQEEWVYIRVTWASKNHHVPNADEDLGSPSRKNLQQWRSNGDKFMPSSIRLSHSRTLQNEPDEGYAKTLMHVVTLVLLRVISVFQHSRFLCPPPVVTQHQTPTPPAPPQHLAQMLESQTVSREIMSSRLLNRNSRTLFLTSDFCYRAVRQRGECKYPD